MALAIGLSYTVSTDDLDVTVSGSYIANDNISLLVTDKDTGSREYINQVKTGSNGSFSLSFSLAEAGDYMIVMTASDGTAVSKEFTVTESSGGGGGGGSSKITVSLEVIGASETYFDDDIELNDGDSPIDALDEAGLDYTLKNGSYVSAIEGEKEDTTTTAGWKYKVNGDVPDLGSSDYELEDGDDLIWFWATGIDDDEEGGDSNGDTTGDETETEDGTTGSSGFTDISSFTWAKTAIEELVNRGIVEGTGNNLFEPKREVTRAEFIKMILLALDQEISDIENSPFPDVGISKWHAPYIAKAKELGIVEGSADGNFYPDASITRQEMTAMIVRAMEKMALWDEENASALSFKDNDQIASWAKDYVAKAYDKGIIEGVGDGYFSPKTYANRAQAAVIIYRILTQ